jgi:hypothetical protein
MSDMRIEYDFAKSYDDHPTQEIVKLISAGYVINLSAHADSLKQQGISIQIELLDHKSIVDIIVTKLDDFFKPGLERNDFQKELLSAYFDERANYKSDELHKLLNNGFFNRTILIEYVNTSLERIGDHHDDKPLQIFKLLVSRGLIDPSHEVYEWSAGQTHERFTLSSVLKFITIGLKEESDTHKLIDKIENFIKSIS